MNKATMVIATITFTLFAQSASAVITELDDIALDGDGSNPFIRFDHSSDPSKFIVGFNDDFGFWTGSSYSVRFNTSAPTDALIVDDVGIAVKNSIAIDDDDNIINLDLFHTGTNQTFGVTSLSENSGLFNGGIGFSTNSASYPFYVFDDAASETLSVNEFGVGVGLYGPEQAIHVYANGFPIQEAQILIENNESLSVGPRTLLHLKNPGNTKFELENTDAMNSWAFTNSGADFRVSLQGSGSVEFRVDNNGDAYLSGLLFEQSDRNAKTNIMPIDIDAVLNKVAEIPISQWAYKDSPETNHIGPMAQDFREAFGTGKNDTTLATMDVGGVAIASIQALNVKLEKQNAELRQRLELLETAIGQLLPQTAKN